jgi:hypothetical protein
LDHRGPKCMIRMQGHEVEKRYVTCS